MRSNLLLVAGALIVSILTAPALLAQTTGESEEGVYRVTRVPDVAETAPVPPEWVDREAVEHPIPIGHAGYHGYPVYPYGGGFYPSYRIGGRELYFSYNTGRRIERYRQDAFELDRQFTQRFGYEAPLLPPPPTGSRGGVYGDAYKSAHNYGRDLEYYKQQSLYLRELLALGTHEEFLRLGIDLMREGAYGMAARAFVAAADKNHEDAGSRVLAAQALMAAGSYGKALDHMRRALELQPLLLAVPINLRDEYGIGLRGDFDDHLNRLRDYCNGHPDDVDGWLLLACTTYFSDRMMDAAAPLKRARALAPRDSLVHKLWDAADPVLDLR